MAALAACASCFGPAGSQPRLTYVNSAAVAAAADCVAEWTADWTAAAVAAAAAAAAAAVDAAAAAAAAYVVAPGAAADIADAVQPAGCCQSLQLPAWAIALAGLAAC